VRKGKQKIDSTGIDGGLKKGEGGRCPKPRPEKKKPNLKIAYSLQLGEKSP